MPTCLECGKVMKWIQNTHLQSHNMTAEDYLKKYPGAQMKGEDLTKVFVETRWRAERRICQRKGCNNPVKGKNNKYCSYSCTGKAKVDNGTSTVVKTGKDNHAYKHGRSNSAGKKVKREAYARDGGICQKCKKPTDMKVLSYGMHHIIPKILFDDPAEADVVENLITLCNKCHRKIESDALHLVFRLYLDGKLMTREELVEHIKATLIYN